MDEQVDLILASGSPRRRELLKLTGLHFEVDAPEVDETTSLPPREAVALLSQRKALSSALRHPGKVILAADTLVSIDGESLGKPENCADAYNMLKRLSGREHQVYTGVCVVSEEGDVYSEVDATDVLFADLTHEDIIRYLASGEPFGKAGAYALQGAGGMFVRRICGTPSGVIGLPLPLVRELLELCGLRCLPADVPLY